MEVNKTENVCQWIESNLLGGLSLRPLQKESIKQHYDYKGKDKHFLTVMPTGGGKSIIFQGPILYEAIVENSRKLNIVISPLTSLIKDQTDGMIRKAEVLSEDVSGMIFSSYSEDSKQNEDPTNKSTEELSSIVKDQRAICLFLTPEKFISWKFYHEVILPALEGQGIGTIVFDEAHCISGWGMNFRPKYVLSLRKIVEIGEEYPEMSIQLFTATLPSSWRTRILTNIHIPEENILPRKKTDAWETALCPLKPYIKLDFRNVELECPESRAYTIANLIKSRDYLGANLLKSPDPQSRVLVFVNRRDDAQTLSEDLSSLFMDDLGEGKVSYFHAGIKSSEKRERLSAFLAGDIVILCCTTAFGLGVDIPNVHLVIYEQPPRFIDDYIQEAGRAGRNENIKREILGQKDIHAICLYNSNDVNYSPKENSLTWDSLCGMFSSILKFSEHFSGSNTLYYPLPEKDNDESDTLLAINWLGSRDGVNRLCSGILTPGIYLAGYKPMVQPYNGDDPRMRRIYTYATKQYITSNRNTIIINLNEIAQCEEFEGCRHDDIHRSIRDCISYGMLEDIYPYILKVDIKNEKFNKNITLLKEGHISYKYSTTMEWLDKINNAGYTSLEHFINCCLSIIEMAVKENGRPLHLLAKEFYSDILVPQTENGIQTLLSFLHRRRIIYKPVHYLKPNHIELQIVNRAEIGSLPHDCEAENIFNNYIKEGTTKANAMKFLLNANRSSDQTKELIKKYFRDY